MNSNSSSNLVCRAQSQPPIRQLLLGTSLPSRQTSFQDRWCATSHRLRTRDSHIANMRVSAQGDSLDGRKPSAETLLHVQIYNRTSARSVLHPHSVNATLLSKHHVGHLVLQDYELLKAFPGIDSHECSVTVPIFKNEQNIGRLADQVDTYMSVEAGPIFGYLINGHGFYTWGDNIESAMRHVEAFEFLFECEMRSRGMKK